MEKMKNFLKILKLIHFDKNISFSKIKKELEDPSAFMNETYDKAYAHIAKGCLFIKKMKILIYMKYIIQK